MAYDDVLTIKNSIIGQGNMANAIKSHLQDAGHPVGSYVTNKKDGSRHLDHNRELFILKQSQGDWLIYRYMYNQTPEQAR